MLTTIIGLLSLGVIVTVHEFGHYIFARWNKVQVEEFAVGMGPKIVSKKIKDTLWSIRVLPLGGFCKMKSADIALIEDKSTTLPQDEGSFHSCSYLGKLMILFGGPLANIVFFIFASILLFFLGGGIRADIAAYIEPTVNPALSSELESGDLILQINDTPIQSYTQLREYSSKHLGEEVTIVYKRDNNTASTTLTLNENSPALGVYPYTPPVLTKVQADSVASQIGLRNGDIIVEVNGNEVTNAFILPSLFYPEENYSLPIPIYLNRNGARIKLETKALKDISLTDLGIQYQIVNYNEWENFPQFVQVKTIQATSILTSTFGFLADILQLKFKKVEKNVAGPIRLISLVGSSTIAEAQANGLFSALVSLLNIIAVLSIAIASLNLLPIPVLDGGQILFYSFFQIRRKEPHVRALLRYNGVGSVFLLLLFAFIVFSDIFSFF